MAKFKKENIFKNILHYFLRYCPKNNFQCFLYLFYWIIVIYFLVNIIFKSHQMPLKIIKFSSVNLTFLYLIFKTNFILNSINLFLCGVILIVSPLSWPRQRIWNNCIFFFNFHFDFFNWVFVTKYNYVFS